jgi:hypothetical protein
MPGIEEYKVCKFTQRKKKKKKVDSHLPSLIISSSMGLETFAGEFSASPVMLVLADELKILAWLPLVSSSNFQSVKYPGLEVTELTSISPESIATTRDIDGRNVGDACVHKRDTPIMRFTSSSLNFDNVESITSTSQLFSCKCQA